MAIFHFQLSTSYLFGYKVIFFSCLKSQFITKTVCEKLYSKHIELGLRFRIDLIVGREEGVQVPLVLYTPIMFAIFVSECEINDHFKMSC